jgi:hypothetical protein
MVPPFARRAAALLHTEVCEWRRRGRRAWARVESRRGVPRWALRGRGRVTPSGDAVAWNREGDQAGEGDYRSTAPGERSAGGASEDSEVPLWLSSSRGAPVRWGRMQIKAYPPTVYPRAGERQGVRGDYLCEGLCKLTSQKRDVGHPGGGECGRFSDQGGVVRVDWASRAAWRATFSRCLRI